MLLFAIGFVIGGVVGWQRAGRRGGDRLDRMQYAAGHGIAFGLVALVAGFALARLGLI